MITNHYYTKISAKARRNTKSMSKKREQRISKDALIGSIIGIGGLALIAIIGIFIHH
tara:strand:+ start:407 stop:577 length:171 start_codon:yes stop_codon:yes gene_type:complete